MRSIVVITAGLSQPSSTRLLADQLSDAVRAQVTARGEDLETEIVELRDLAGDLAQTMATGGIPTPRLTSLKERISASEGLIAVTPVFAASYSGLFKMFFDILDPDALTGLPVLIAATAGTPRHSLVLDHALRPLFTYFRAVVVPTGVFAATEDFGGSESGLSGRITRAAAEFAALVVSEVGAVGGFTQSADSARPRRDSGTGLPNADVPFEDLLRGHSGSLDIPQHP